MLRFPIFRENTLASSPAAMGTSTHLIFSLGQEQDRERRKSLSSIYVK